MDVYPSPVARVYWAIRIARHYRENGSVTAVLKHVVFLAKTLEGGCWQAQENMALDMNYSLATVARGLAVLVNKNILAVERRFQKTNVYRPQLHIPHCDGYGTRSMTAHNTHCEGYEPLRVTEEPVPGNGNQNGNQEHVFEARDRAKYTLDPSFVESLKADYPTIDVEQEIAASFNHIGVDRAKSLKKWVRDWIRRAWNMSQTGDYVTAPMEEWWHEPV